MNVLAAVCIAPCGIGDEFAPYVAPVIQCRAGHPDYSGIRIEKSDEFYVHGNRRRVG